MTNWTDIVVDGKRLAPEEALRDLDRADCEDSLYTFLEYAWRYIDPSPFVPGWPLEAIAEHLQAVVDGDIRKLVINIPPRMGKSTICSVAFPAWVWAQRYDSPTSGPSVPLLHASYALSLAMRDSVKCRRLIESPWYQSLWGNRFQLVGDQNTKGRFQNSQRGERLITAVDARVTGEGGNIIVVDDPNAANEALSRAMIEACTEWWDGTMSTRLNDSKNGAFVVIQQRLGEQDLTGHILETDTGWTHLCLPMKYEPDRSFVTLTDWKDPRTEAGELLWPDRFNEAQVKELEKRLGPWKCNPGEAPILMADLSMKRLDQVKAGDEVVGFSKNTLAQNASFSRHSLTPATVTEVHQYVAEIVEITLDSGRKIRCTPDHKWFTKDRGPSRKMYMPATLRSSLARVCEPELPVLSEKDLRDAGWLAGFFDGEGSVTQQRRTNASDKAGHTICFYQGAGRNLPLCQKLERLLTKFGFEWSYTEDERKPNKNAPCYGYRTYRIKGGGLPVLQRFLHIVQPTKWRDRIINAAYKANFIQQRERVVSIVPAGRATVYGLTTTTGNYVVWGLASSNSAGQLQQRPEPAGGGIIKREWWEPWPDAAYPPMDFIVASVDTAYTTKTENDYSAMTVWGVFSGDVVAQNTKEIKRDGNVAEAAQREYGQQHARVMLMTAWQERLELHDLVKKIAETCKSMKVDKLLIEDKAAGHSVAQEMRRMFGYEDFTVQLINPGAIDKMARLYSIQHLFAEGMIYAPDRSWSDMVITQCGTFPKARHDDLCDTVSMTLRHMRDIGLLSRSAERLAEVQDSMRHRGGSPKPLYDI